MQVFVFSARPPHAHKTALKKPCKLTGLQVSVGTQQQRIICLDNRVGWSLLAWRSDRFGACSGTIHVAGPFSRPGVIGRDGKP